jgi:O-antigen ligase
VARTDRITRLHSRPRITVSPLLYSRTILVARENLLAGLIALTGAAIAASLFYSPLPFVAILGIPLCIFFITRPYELLLFMVFLIPFNFVFKVGPVPVAVELLKVFAWVPLFITRKERGAFVTSRFDKWIAVLGVLIFLSLIRAHDFPFTLKECVRFASNLGLVYLCVNLVDTREKVLQMLKVLTVSTFAVACYGFYQWAIQDYGFLFWIVNPRMDTSLAHYRDNFWEWRNRMISVLTSEMELGHYFNLCLPIAVVLWFTEGRKRLTSKWLLMSICILAGLVLTFTFGAWLALGATFALFALLFGGAKRKRVIVAGVLVLALAAAFVAYGPLRPLIEAKAAGDAIGSFAWDAMTRLYSWKLALQTWWSHPWIGVGIGNFEFISAGYDFVLGPESQGSSPHQTYLYLLANYGLVGTISVLAIMLGALRSNLRLARLHTAIAFVGLALAFALAVNLIGWFADDSGFLGPHASYLLWLFVGLSEVALALSSPAEWVGSNHAVENMR